MRLSKARLPEGVEGVARFHELVGALVEDPAEVVIGIETDRGLFVTALVAFDDLASGDAVEVLRVAPTPTLGAGLSRSKIAAALRRGGRQRRVEERAVEIQAALRSEQLHAPAAVAAAMGASVAATVA